MKDSKNRSNLGILYSFIAAAVIIGVLAVTAVRSAGKLSEMYLDSSEGSQALISELITVKDCIGSAEKELLAAFSAQDDAAETEFLNAAKAELDALEDTIAEDRLGIWSEAEPINELIEAAQLRSAVFGSVNGGSRNIARNVFFSEYQPRLKAAEEYADGRLSDARDSSGELSEKLSAKASVYERLCIGTGLLGISAMTFIGLYLDKKLRESAKAESNAIPEAHDEAITDDDMLTELRRQLSEAEVTVENAVNSINILADGDPDAAADGDYPRRYENVLSAVRKMKGRLKFINSRISRGAEFVSAESDRVSDNGGRLSEAVGRQEKAAKLLEDITAQLSELAAEVGEISGKIRSGSEKCVSAAEECGVQLGTLRGTADMLKKGTDGLDTVSSAAADIAGRANRLAVSAAVNAAKGGDKSIAAFADEARGLALCASKLSEDAGEKVKLLDSGINESIGAISSASENISRVIDRARETYDGGGRLENACAGELEALARAKKCTGDISEAARLCGDISEENAASGRKLSEQSEALKKIF